MNQSLLCFKSYDEINSRNSFIDHINVYVLTLTSLFGILTNGMCIYVLNHLNRREFMVKFMLAYSCLDMSFQCISISVGFIRCGSLCSFGFTQWAKYIELYFYIFGQNVILLTCFLLELCISINRIVSFTNRKSPYSIINNSNFLQVLMGIAVFSVVIIAVSYFSLREVKQFGCLKLKEKSEALYMVGANTDVTNKIIIALNVNRGAMLLLILFLLNLIILFKYHSYVRKREKRNLNRKSMPIFVVIRSI
jgi:hypothetical protein